jgi:esterase/lipase superfamily enzyme
LDEVGSLIRMPALEHEPGVLADLMLAAGELREYLRKAMLRPRASTAKVAMGIAVLDIWRQTTDMESRHSEIDGAVTAAVASLGVATSGDVSDSDELGDIVRACRKRIEASIAPDSRWERIWQRAEAIGRDIGFRIDLEAARAERLWTALIAFSAPDAGIDLRAASPEALSSLLVVESKIRATGDAILAAVKSDCSTPDTAVEVGGSDDRRMQADHQRVGHVEPEDEASRVMVWFGTNREPASRHQPDSSYTNRLANGELFYGVCHVNVPKVEEPGGGPGPYISAWLQLGDRRGRLRVERYFRFSGEIEFLNALQEETAKAPTERTGLIFLHGYATNFTAAATAAARISLGIKHQGPTAMFSWASKGTKHAYRHDETVVEQSRQQLTAFLKTLTMRAGLEQIDVVVHSLGNRLFLRSLIDWFKGPAPGNVPFRNIYLGAPDVDQHEFQNHAGVYAVAGERTTLYGSNSDSALLASRILHRGTWRAGMTPPAATYLHIDTIETSGGDPSRLRHAYVIDAPAIRADIFSIQKGIHQPSKRANINPAGSTHAPDYWLLS